MFPYSLGLLCGRIGPGATPLAAVAQSRHLKLPMVWTDEIEWRASEVPVPYDEALRFMEERAAAIRDRAAL